jgi:mRNA-degrading endonuclease RelE of RelBE toxin-antitoxin system
LRIRLTARAERQIAELPVPAARKVVVALRALGAVPDSGRRYPDDSDFRGLHYKLVVVRARRWSYRITYEIRTGEIVIYYLYPSWYPATHPDLAARDDED